jgi:hypothetical protein
MSVIDRFILLVRDLRRSERGMALPAAMFATIASLGMAGAAVMSSVNVQHGSHRDGDSKSAIAAADAGANIALLRLNRYATAFSTSTPCLGVSGGTLVLSAATTDGWCPPVSGSVGDSTYVYRATPVTATTMSVVATGTSDSVSRRIAVTYDTTTIGDALGKEGLIGVDDLHLDENADARVGIGTNGNVTVDNNANVCGNIRKGVGKEHDTDGSTQCTGYTLTEGNVTLPPVSSFMPTDILENNSNYRLATCTKIVGETREPTGCQEDSYTGKWKSTEPWNPSTRSIYMSGVGGGTTLTLGGGDYFICRLYIKNNSHLVMKEGAQVRIFFDTPEKCGIKAGEKQIDVSNNSDVTATGYQPEIGKFDMPGFYVMGSESIPTTIEFSPNGGANEFILYAPNSNIVIKNNATYTGVIAGKTVHFEKATLKQDAGFKPPEIGGATIFERQSYVECTGTTATPPNAGC